MAASCSRLAVWLLAAAFLPPPASAEDHMVGGSASNGWTLTNYIIGWAEDQTFRVNDTLVFNYPAGNYTVTEVDSQTFRDCYRQGNTIAEWTTGHDVVPLDKTGRRWFFSSLDNHCDLGLKLVVNVVPADGTPAPAAPPAPGAPTPDPVPTTPPPTAPPPVHTPVSPAPAPNAPPPPPTDSSSSDALMNHRKISEAVARAAVVAGAVQALVAGVLLIVAAVLTAPAFAADIVVGDDQGWRPNFDYDKWVDGNEFFVNDTLVFRYAKGQHSVVQATEAGFAACSQANSLGVWTSGDDRVALNTSGQWWFLSGVNGDCSQGMKFNVTVLPEVELSLPPAPAPAPTTPPSPDSSTPVSYAVGGAVAAAGAAVVAAAVLAF
ncbi:hypothetical protein U9M48_011823 [Paspalum notatum var. saurae]|uniref:Phytocyanin domain-containing protein n=1 Tax=Paspalum notatum var. saurae TaxID=547442 RepID=A0AAQ3SWF3_PASNO